MKPINLIYILSTYPSLTTTFVDREVIALQQMGVNLHILALQKPGPLLSAEQKELQKGVTYFYSIPRLSAVKAHLYSWMTRPRRYFSTLLYLLTRPKGSSAERRKTLRHFHLGIVVADYLRRMPVDHIHVHLVNWALVGLVSSRVLGVPYSVTAHASGDIFVNPFMLREKFGNAKFVATCTGYNWEYLKQVGKDDFGDKVRCIYHGLDIDRYQRRQPVYQADRPVILSVGQLKVRKGFQVLVAACSILDQNGLDFECQIAGDGPVRVQLEAQIRQLVLEDKVSLLGQLSHAEVFARYEQANIFALPALLASDGDRDGIPNVILEAMAMELPIVSTRHSAIPEAVEDGVNGQLVAPGDPQVLAGALERLLKNPELRERLGKNARRTVAEKFNPRKNAQLLLDEITSQI